jgi:superfamily II DNA or RNA helicase
MESRRKIYKIYNKFKRPLDIIDANEVCNSKNGFKLELQQEFLKKYIIEHITTINKILLYHSIGSGKTCTSITIAEEIMSYDKNYKTLVILPARLNSNYVDELISSCGFNKYISKEDYNNFIAFDTPLKIKKTIERKFMKLIKEKYTFYSYEKLFNLAKKQSNVIEWIQKITKNKVIIIDEVHNLISGKYDIKNKTLTQSLFYHLFLTNLNKSSKSFFLTATPIFDNYRQFVELAKVLNSDVKIDGKENIQTIINLLKGKISYYDATNLNAYPSVEYKIEQIPLTQKQNDIISLINNPDEEDNQNEMFLIKQRQYSISTISNISSISNKNLSLHAPKLVKIKDSIIENKGKHLVYCTFIKKGLNILEEILKRYGYVNYYNDSSLNESNNYKRYIIWDSKLKNTQKQSIKNITNSYDNVDGKIIKVILGSPSIKEGISFKHIQHLHIVDPVWNISAMNQIEGRAIRYCSHVDISPTDKNLKRTVILHYYKSIANPSLDNPISMTCDERIYDIILPKKEIIIQACENALKKVAFDYYLFNKKSSTASIISEEDSKSSVIDIEELKDTPHTISPNKKLKNNCPKPRRPINDICNKGYMVKKNANGFKCCYKIPKIVEKSSCPKNRRPVDDKCKEGFYNKLNKKGDECCYKIRIKKCPDTKEIHPITGKCVPLCKYGKIRNSKGRCVIYKN